mmetsp:Transcript_4717/g.9298  ORF Transcript_4717/g.9298 Transcript_4717/m.9298 type:complete len:101 (+) Transcript_4717:280-582(+)
MKENYLNEFLLLPFHQLSENLLMFLKVVKLQNCVSGYNLRRGTTKRDDVEERWYFRSDSLKIKMFHLNSRSRRPRQSGTAARSTRRELPARPRRSCRSEA